MDDGPTPRVLARGHNVAAQIARRATISRWLMDCRQEPAGAGVSLSPNVPPDKSSGGIIGYVDRLAFDKTEVCVSDGQMPSIGARWLTESYTPDPLYFMDIVCDELGVPRIEIIDDKPWFMGRCIRARIYFEIAGPLTLMAYRAQHRPQYQHLLP